MQEIISLVVANGLWAVLFCGLLVYELRDSRRRESRYTQTIRALTERLGAVTDIRAEASEIKTDTADIRSDVKKLCADSDTIKSSVLRGNSKSRIGGGGGAECATGPA